MEKDKIFSMNWVSAADPQYKILSLTYFLKMIEEGMNTLLRPYVWTDPLETIYANSDVEVGLNKIPLDGSKWFAQSWSFKEEDERMWQAFGPQNKNDRRVKIRIMSGNIFNYGILRKSTFSSNSLKLFVFDRVRYFKNTDEYKDSLEDANNMHNWLNNMTKRGAEIQELLPCITLLTKRDYFNYENETRLLIYDKDFPTNEEYYKYPLNFKEVCEEVVLDPWTPDDEIEKIKGNIQEKLKNDRIPIYRSHIYDDYKKYRITFNTK